MGSFTVIEGDVVLRDETGNPVGVILDGAVYRLRTEAKLAAGSALVGKVQLRNPADTQNLGDSTNPVRTDPTGTTAQPVTNAALDATLSSRASEATLLDVEAALALLLTTAAFQARINTLGQKAMAASTPVVLPSDQSAIPVSQAPTEEATFTAVGLGITIGNNKSMLSLFNPVGSTKVLKLREYYVRNAQTTAVTGVAGDFRLFRWAHTTAPTGGTAIIPRSHDTADTLGAGIDLRTGGTLGGTEEAQPLDVMKISTDEWGPGTLDVEAAQQTIANYLPARAKRDPIQKPFVVRPGQGIHLKHVVNSTAGSFDIIFVFTQVD